MITTAQDAYHSQREEYEALIEERNLLRSRLEKTEKMTLDIHKDYESMSRKYQGEVKAKETAQKRYNDVKAQRDSQKDQLAVQKKSLAQYERTVKSLESQLQAFQRSKSVGDGQRDDTKLRLAQERTKQIQLQELGKKQQNEASMIGAEQRKELALQTYKQKRDIDAQARENERVAKKRTKVNRMEQAGLHLSAFNSGGTMGSALGRGFPNLHEASRDPSWRHSYPPPTNGTPFMEASLDRHSRGYYGQRGGGGYNPKDDDELYDRGYPRKNDPYYPDDPQDKPLYKSRGPSRRPHGYEEDGYYEEDPAHWDDRSRPQGPAPPPRRRQRDQPPRWNDQSQIPSHCNHYSRPNRPSRGSRRPSGKGRPPRDDDSSNHGRHPRHEDSHDMRQPHHHEHRSHEWNPSSRDGPPPHDEQRSCDYPGHEDHHQDWDNQPPHEENHPYRPASHEEDHSRNRNESANRYEAESTYQYEDEPTNQYEDEPTATSALRTVSPRPDAATTTTTTSTTTNSRHEQEGLGALGALVAAAAASESFRDDRE